MIESRMMNMCYRSLTAFLLAVLPAAGQQPAGSPAGPAAPPAAAPAPVEPARLEVQLSPAAIGVGEQALLTIRIADGRRLENFPQEIEVDGLSIQFNGNTSQSFSNGNRMVRSMELRYSVEGLEKGTYTIPPQNLTVDGKIYQTRDVQITVNDGPPVDEALQPQVQLSTAKTEMWEGEEVPVTVSVLMHRAVQLTSQPFPVIKSEGIAVSRFDRNARIDQTEVNGQLWNSWQMPSAVVAMRAGDLTLGPAEVKVDALLPSPGAQRDPFGGFSTVRRTLKIKSNSVPLKVKPLPAEGKPDGFTGVVGNFVIVARTESNAGGPVPLQLGDPVGFELMVTGTGNFDAITAPVLEPVEGLRAYKPKLSQESRGPGSEPGQKTFTQIVFTSKPGPLTAVFALPYFDPSTGKYAVAKSKPVEFIVTGDAVAAAAADTAAGAETRDYDGAGDAAAPQEDLRDILPGAVEGGRWLALPGAAGPVHPLLLHGLPAVLLAAVLSAGAFRRLRAWRLSRRPPPFAPRDCALIARDLRGAGLSRARFYGFVSEYVTAWQYWRKSPLPEDGEALASVLAARDFWLYATRSEAASGPVPPEEQKQVLATLHARLSA